MKPKTTRKMKDAFKSGYVSGVYWTLYRMPFVDDDIREKIVKWFEDMHTDAIVTRYGGEAFWKLINDHLE